MGTKRGKGWKTMWGKRGNAGARSGKRVEARGEISPKGKGGKVGKRSGGKVGARGGKRVEAGGEIYKKGKIKGEKALSMRGCRGHRAQ